MPADLCDLVAWTALDYFLPPSRQFFTDLAAARSIGLDRFLSHHIQTILGIGNGCVFTAG
jgi:hypothetical protein